VAEPDGKPASAADARIDRRAAAMAVVLRGASERTGEGKSRGLALDTYFSHARCQLPKVLFRGDDFVPKREGSAASECGRSACSIAAVASSWYLARWRSIRRWCGAGRPELEKNPRLSTARAAATTIRGRGYVEAG